MIRLELAAVIEGGSIFRSNSYFLEGNGPFIFVAFDKVISIFSFIENNQWPNVDAVIESVVPNHPHPAVETLRLKLMQRALFILAFITSPKSFIL